MNLQKVLSIEGYIFFLGGEREWERREVGEMEVGCVKTLQRVGEGGHGSAA